MVVPAYLMSSSLGLTSLRANYDVKITVEVKSPDSNRVFFLGLQQMSHEM